jgi:hypothetical protein
MSWEEAVAKGRRAMDEWLEAEKAELLARKAGEGNA